MIFLLLSILSSTAIFVVFKLFKKYNVNTQQAIVVNYFMAFAFGIMANNTAFNSDDIVSSDWFYGAVALGFLFIAIFNVMALTAQKNGLSVASVASKMSVIIPIVFGIFIFKESIGTLKIIGIILALIAVYLTSLKQKDDVVLTKSIYLPIILFLGSGIIDTSVNFFAPDDKIPLFSAVIFACAGIIGCLILVYKAMTGTMRFKLKSIPFGMALGVLNYYSIYFLLKALRVEGFESSTLFTINNVGIVAFSTLIGLLLFKEHISLKNWLGIGISIISILLVTSA